MDRQYRTIATTAFKVLAALLLTLPATGTTVFRVDPPAVMVTAGTVPPGGLPALYAVAGATVSIYTDAAGTLPATTYTDTTGGTTCPTTAQVVQAGTAVCSASTGSQGQFGFWLASGTTYYYRITLPSGSTVGPLPLTSATTGVTGLTAGTGINVSGATGSVTISNTGAVTVTGGTAITCSPTSGSVVCNNTGVTSAVAGTGIGVSGATGAVTFSNTGVTSFNSRTGAVSPATSDYTWSQIAGTKQGNTNVPQMAGTNSGVTSALLCNDANGNATTTGCSGGSSLPSATSQTQYLQVTPNSGNLTTFQWNKLPVANPLDYNFSVSPSGTISAGSNTVTLTACPLGVSGTDSNHVIYLATTGTPESVTITGGSCTGTGQTGGTITFTASNSHSAGYTINSATLGMQEAANFYGTGGVHMLFPPVSGTVHGLATFPNTVWVEGGGKYVTVLNVDGTTITASAVMAFTSSSLGKLSDVEIVYGSSYNPSSGYGVLMSSHEAEMRDVIVSGTGNYGAYIGVGCTSAGICRLIDVDVYEPKLYGIESGTASLYALHSSATCGDPNQCTAGFHIIGGNTVWLDQVSTEQGQSGIFVDITAAAGGLGDAYFSDIVVDNANANGVYFKCSSSCTTGGTLIAMNGGEITTAAAVSANGVTVDSGGVANAWTNLDIRNFNIICQSGAQASILAKGITHGVISSNTLASCDNSAGTGINFSVNANTKVSVVGNLMQPAALVGTTCAANALFMDTAAHADIFVDGNSMCAGTATITNTNTGGALQVTLANQMTLGPPTVASASALAVPPDPVFFLSGTTNVTSFTQLASNRPREFVIIPTNASPGTIACRATLTPTQYQRISVTWDGTNVYCH